MKQHKKHIKYNLDMRQRKSAAHIISQMIKMEFKDTNSTIIVAVGGPGGTGKSTFCKKLKKHLSDSSILKLDDYKTAREERVKSNLFGAHPNANKMDLIAKHLNLLKNSKSIEKPIYNTNTGEILASEIFKPASIIILDGEISTYPQFREFIDLSIFIDSHWKTQLATRIDRDVEIRGYSKEKAVDTFLQSNLREFSEFGAESKLYSDVHIYCTDKYHHILEAIDEKLLHHFQKLHSKELQEITLFGLIVAVTTPFNKNKKIDEPAFALHLKHLFKNGISKILVAGTTGEFFSLTASEKIKLLKLARAYFPGTIIFQVGSANLEEALLLSKQGELLGADAILSVPPYYIANAPQKGIVNYFNKISESISIPFMIYNFPKHSQNPINSEMLADISHFGIKDSSKDFSLIDATPNYFVGGDSVILKAHKKGVAGFVSVQGNYAPKLMSDLENAITTKNLKEAERLQEIVKKNSKVFAGTNQIAMIKRALSIILVLS